MNLIQRQKNIIQHLCDFNEWQTGKELSSLFQVSLRTIRSDIAHINKEYNNEIIISSKYYGYKLDKPLFITESKPIKAIMDSDERITRILIELLSNPLHPIHFYDLADQYHISEYTLIHDLNTIKNIIMNHPYYNVFIEKKQEFIIVSGNELQCGKMLHAYLKSKGHYKNFEKYDNCFANITLINIVNTIHKFFSVRQYTRYLSFEDIFIFTSIYLEQSYHNESPHIDNEPVMIPNDFKDYIQYISCELNPLKKEYFIQQFMGAIIPLITMEKQERHIKENTNENDPLYPVLSSILVDVKDIFSLDISSHEKLILDFLIHIKTALLRMENGVTSNNPLLEYIRLNYTFLFDVAYYISKQLSEHLGQQFSREEISFFVVYLINPLKNIKETLLHEYNVEVLLYTIEGYSISKNIKELILKKVDNKKINITSVDNYFDFQKLSLKHFDFLITTSQHLQLEEIECCIINPFVTLIDIKNINQYIQNIYLKKKQLHFDQLFHYFFTEKTTAFNQEQSNQKQCIQYICNELFSLGITPDDYFDQVLERESLISTAFDSGIALPHATKNSTFKSNIFFMNLNTPLDWEGKKIKSIFLFAIAKEDVDILNLIYQIIINICSSDIHATQLSKIKTFEEFKILMNKIYLELN